MAHYLLHGLRVWSSKAIPGLQPIESKTPVDLRVWLGRAHEPPGFDAQGPTELWYETPFRDQAGRLILTAVRFVDSHYHRITYLDGIEFIINKDAADVWATWPESLSVSDVPSYLLGPVIGVILRMRGVLCLHASAVEIDNHAVLFIGAGGLGKSTTAAAFAATGAPVLSDDTVALRERGSAWTATPGYPRLRLWRESVEAIADDTGDHAFLPPGTSGSHTRFHLDLTAAGLRFQSEVRPVAAIYELDDQDAPAPAAFALRQTQALMTLFSNTYAPRSLARELRAAELDALARLVSSVPVRHLSRPDNLNRLRDLCEFIKDDVRRLPAIVGAGG